MNQGKLIDAAIDAYIQWREECKAVWDAYRGWASAAAADAGVASQTYEAALDREECAAMQYADLIARVGDMVELGLAEELAEIRPNFGA